MTGDPVPARKSAFRGLFETRGMRFVIMIALIVLMAVPVFMVWGVVADRATYNEAAVAEVSEVWGGQVGIAGPAIHVPVTRTVVTVVTDDDGVETTETAELEGDPIILLPDTARIDIDATSQIRRRGIFEVPVYSARFGIVARFDPTGIDATLKPNERARLDEAELVLKLPTRRAFVGTTTIAIDGQPVDPEPGTPVSGIPGIRMPVGLARGAFDANLEFGLNGAQTLSVSPLARDTTVTIASDWPDPSFAGSFLPGERNVAPEGFTASWTVPHLAFDIPQISRGTRVLGGQNDGYLHWSRGPIGPFGDPTAFGVRFIQELDFYQLVERAVKYGFLFISLTFLTLFLLEGLSAAPIHAAQFILIGIAECVFFLLLLSFAEQIGFTPAYLCASAATIGLLGFYGLTGLRLGGRVWVLVTLLELLYTVLFIILRSADYALLAGSLISFGAVAATMYVTRNERWGRAD